MISLSYSDSAMSDNENVNEEKIDPSSSCSNEDTTTLKIKPENNTRQTKVTHVCDTNNKDDIDAKNQEEESCECTICYLPLVENIDKVVLEECGHIFHSKCIRSWMKQKRTCPFCAGFSLLPEEYPRLI